MEMEAELKTGCGGDTVLRTSTVSPKPDQQRPGSPVLFSEVETVASGWMLEFACRCLCRYFCEDNHQDFEKSRDLALTIIKGLRRIEAHQVKTVCICQLLVCVAEGKSLDSHLGSDQSVSPLENALSAWTLLQKVQSIQDKLHEEIKHLIQIQAVAVQMNKGDFKKAAEVLERLFPESASNEPLRMKLAAVIRQKDPYHQLLQHFSFNFLTKKIKSFLCMFSNEEESDNFLMKEATKAAETKKSEKITGVPCDGETEAAAEKLLGSIQRSYKESCSLTGQTFWNLEQTWHPHRISIKKQKAHQSKKVLKSIENIQEGDGCLFAAHKKRPWNFEEDKKLKDGVRKFGVGKWNQILQHYDFSDRTNVMLKDRWRTLVRLDIV